MQRTPLSEPKSFSHDFDSCRACTGNVHEDDMAGVGANCSVAIANRASCFTGGRIDICW